MREHVSLGMKPPAVHGRAQVQLFDDRTGREVYRDAQDNFVSERWLRAMAYVANWAVFADNNTLATNPVQSAAAYTRIPFTGIALTDYSGAPSQSERLVRGKPLAHASRGVAGGGAYRGGYNEVESRHRATYHKFVYDFATSEANGTFQSIYSGMFDSFNNNTSTSRTSGGAPRLSSRMMNPVLGTCWVRDPGSGKLLQCDARYVYEISDWSPALLGLTMTRDVVIDFGSDVNQDGSYTIKDGRLYWLTSHTSSARQIKSAPLTDLSSHRTELRLDAAWTAANGGIPGALSWLTGFTYSDTHNAFLLGNTYTAANNGFPFGIAALDPVTFSTLGTWGSGHNYLAVLNTYPGETNVLAQGNPRSAIVDKARSYRLEGDGSLTESAHLYQWQAMQGAGDIGFASQDSAVSANQLYVAVAQHFFSRALLDEPVTKTNANTMKITYEFTFDKPELI